MTGGDRAPVDRFAITGVGVLCAAGVGRAALAGAMTAGAPSTVPVQGMYDEPLPVAAAAALAEFDVRAFLGRKGTTFLDRCTGLALVAAQQALADGAVQIDDGTRDRIGVVLGTTAGSLRSTFDYSRETLVADKPFLVNPALFPNTVMNCAAGQTAIRFGLRGVNATIAEGQLAFLAATRYATNALRRGYADTLLVGAVEEFTPHNAWTVHLMSGGAAVAGEAAIVFVLEPVANARGAGRPVAAELLGQAFAYHRGRSDDAAVGEALAGCIRRVVARAGVAPEQVEVVATGENDRDDRVEVDAVVTALGVEPQRRLLVKPVLGECQAANGGLSVAALICAAEADSLALVTGRAPDGGAACALWRLAPTLS